MTHLAGSQRSSLLSLDSDLVSAHLHVYIFEEVFIRAHRPLWKYTDKPETQT